MFHTDYTHTRTCTHSHPALDSHSRSHSTVLLSHSPRVCEGRSGSRSPQARAVDPAEVRVSAECRQEEKQERESGKNTVMILRHNVVQDPLVPARRKQDFCLFGD